MATMYRVLGVTLLLVALTELVFTEVVIKDHWDGGFLADVILHAPADLHGWTIRIIFSSPVDSLHLWDAMSISNLNYGKERRLVSKNYNKNLVAGELLKFEIEGHIKGSHPPSATVYFEGYPPSSDHNTTSLYHPHPSSTAPHANGNHTATAASHNIEEGSHDKYNFTKLIEKSILFYEAQRSGKLPANNRIPWRGDSALNDHGDHGEDLTGGWYDAGDHIKFNLPMAASVTWLTWGLLKWQDAYQAAGQLDHMYDCLKWPLDYLLKCWQPQRHEYYVQVGKASNDHKVWGRAEDMTMARPAYKVTSSKPGSDVAGQTAAAMAAGSIAFKTRNRTYSDQLINAAKTLYHFAKTYKGKYTDSVPDIREFYASSDFQDDLSLAAVWLFKATNDKQYLTDAEHFVPSHTAWALDWDEKGVATQLLLYEITGKTEYSNKVNDFLRNFMPGGSVHYTPCGLAFRDKWGPFSYAANAAMIALLAADDNQHPKVYRAWALGQIHYMLGDNKYGMSYVVGFGNKYPLRPHHAGASCPGKPATCDWSNFNSPAANPHILQGTLVGGPDQHDNYRDTRNDYIHNEVACDYNAGFQSAVAGLLHLKIHHRLPAADLRGCDH